VKGRVRGPTFKAHSGVEVAHPCGIDMLLEPSDLSIGEGPHVGHLHFGELAGGGDLTPMHLPASAAKRAPVGSVSQ